MTIYKCDRCHVEVPKFGGTLTVQRSKHDGANLKTIRTLDLCQACLPEAEAEIEAATTWTEGA